MPMSSASPKMPRRKRSPKTVSHLGCTISPFRKTQWRASIPRQRGLGRVRKTFYSLDDAKGWVEKNISSVRTDLSDNPPTPGEIADLRTATSILPPGISLMEAVRAGIGAIQRQKKRRTISSTEAVSAFLDEKRAAKCRTHTIEGYKGMLKTVPQTDNLASVTTDDLIKAIGTDRGDCDWNNHCKALATFFRWACRKNYIDESPAADLPRRIIDWTPPEIYSTAEVKKILRHAEKKAPDLVPYLALAAFSGIRSSGIHRLTTESVRPDLGTILVPGIADKLRSGYISTMQPNLKAWLEKYPYKKFRYCYGNWNDKITALILDAGVPRKDNAMRHAFASHLYALTGDPIRVSSQLGHWKGDISTLLEHYRRIVPPAEGKSYFAIYPTTD